jgi:hypothetical protein
LAGVADPGGDTEIIGSRNAGEELDNGVHYVRRQRVPGKHRRDRLSCQRPLQFGIFKEGHFVSFAERQGAFERAADIVGAGAHSEIVGDGIQTIDKRFWKPNKDGTSFWLHDDESI